MKKEAIISKCKKYRHWLTRSWDDKKELAAFIMLNPSTADDKIDDPTIKRCIDFAISWGFGGFVVVNLFDYRATDPKDLKKAEAPCSELANHFVKQAIEQCSLIVPAWGNHGDYLGRSTEIKSLIESYGFPEYFQCLGFNKTGEPKHPLYIKGDTQLIDYLPLKEKKDGEERPW